MAWNKIPIKSFSRACRYNNKDTRWSFDLLNFDSLPLVWEEEKSGEGMGKRGGWSTVTTLKLTRSGGCEEGGGRVSARKREKEVWDPFFQLCSEASGNSVGSSVSDEERDLAHLASLVQQVHNIKLNHITSKITAKPPDQSHDTHLLEPHWSIRTLVFQRFFLLLLTNVFYHTTLSPHS